MVQLFATQEEIVKLLELYLDEARKGAVEAIAVIAYTPEQNLKNALLVEGANANGFLGTVRLLETQLEHEILDIEANLEREEEALARITSSADESKPQ